MDEDVKKCPYCGEEILAVAKKCKHCGEFVEKESTQDIVNIAKKIGSLHSRISYTPFKINEKIKRELEQEIDKCERLFASLCKPGYRPFTRILDAIYGLTYLFAIICGFCSGSIGGFFIAILIGLLIHFSIWLYFLPSYFAFRNSHKQAWLILTINIFFTIFCLPWFAILFWALSNKHNEDVISSEQTQRIQKEVMPLYEKIDLQISGLWEEYKKKQIEQ